jgi:hypothetical protein
MKEINLYKSKWKALKLILGCAIFVAIGIFAFDEKKILGLTCIIFFGLGLIVGFFQLFDQRPQIIINEIGVFDRTTLKEFINWEVIYDAYLIDISRQKFICLIIDENYKPSNYKSNIYKKFVRLNEELGAQELNLSVSPIAIDAEKLLMFIKALIASERTQKIKMLEQGI